MQRSPAQSGAPACFSRPAPAPTGSRAPAPPPQRPAVPSPPSVPVMVLAAVRLKLRLLQDQGREWQRGVGVSASACAHRFMPRVEIVQKHNTAARRLYIRGHNGKVYPYLVMNDACLTESRREERVLQLLRLLNPCLEKRKETTKRHLFFTGTGALGHAAIFSTVSDLPGVHPAEWVPPRCLPGSWRALGGLRNLDQATTGSLK